MSVLTRWILRTTLALLAASAAFAGTFGKVVPIGGHASDIALDERRGVVYVANFTANRIDVVSTADYSLKTPIGVPPQPAALALSPDSRYLVVAHYAKWKSPGSIQPALTILDLDGDVRQTLSMAAPPLAVGFGGMPLALIVAGDGFQLLDPATGRLQPIAPAGLGGMDLPVPAPTFPPEIVMASMGVSGDKQWLVGIASGGTAGGGESTATIHFRYHVFRQELNITGIIASPPLGPRVVSTNLDGSVSLLGWGMFSSRNVLLAEFPKPDGSFNVGSHAWDWPRSLIYAEIPEGNSPEGAVLHVLDSDNLTVRERIRLPEHLAGKSVLSSDVQTMYSVSDSGLMVLPVGSLPRAPRVVARQEDMVFRGNFCDRKVMTQDLEIVDPGGGNTPFTISGATRGVTISPTSGFTPATVRVTVDPLVFQNQRGTTAVRLNISSAAAVNIPPPVRVLINTREPDQRGAFYNVPGKLVDILADPVRNRFYVIRQDKNQVLVFDGSSFGQIAVLRTGNTPTQMAMTMDRRYLIVGNDDSQIANVYDLETLTQSDPIVFPFGHYPRSIAVSSRSILASVRGVSPLPDIPGAGTHTIDRVDFETRTATTLPSLGIYENNVDEETVLSASTWGGAILAAMPSGKLLLYDASADTFVAAREDLEGLSGALAALTDHQFVVDKSVLNWSLVPTATLSAGGGLSSGFVYLDGYGLRTTAASPSGPGTIERVDLLRMESIRPTMLVEAPLLAGSMQTERVGQIGQTILPFTRTLAPLSNRESIVSLSTSGFIVLPWVYDTALAKPVITQVVNAADGGSAVAPGGLISVFGANLSPTTAVNNEIPVPTTLGEACLTVNGVLAPLFLASPTRINAQLPFGVTGSAKMILRSAGGMSDPFTFTILSAAPAVFLTGTAGPDTGLATVYRATNNLLVTLSNPIHPTDHLVIYATGLGATTASLEAGYPAPADPLAVAQIEPVVTLGGVSLPVTFAGLVPGQVGVYQINVYVPDWAPTGMQVPLVIAQGERRLELTVRVVR